MKKVQSIFEVYRLLDEGCVLSKNGTLYRKRGPNTVEYKTEGGEWIPALGGITNISDSGNVFEIHYAPKWSDSIPKKGVLCWVSGKGSEDRYAISLVLQMDDSGQLYGSMGNWWQFATPLTREELLEFANDQS